MQGTAPKDILAAVQAYGQTTAGYTRGKVKFSDNWFRGASWEDHVAERTEAEKLMSWFYGTRLSAAKTG